MNPIVRPLVDSDLDRVVELNSAAVPAVNEVDGERMRALVALAHAAIVVADPAHPDAVLGFALAMRPGVAYDSENYRWFTERGGAAGAFLYVDRIVVAEGHRGAGLGARLYESIFAEAAALGASEIDCEVNVEPPNPGSLAFHGRLGFAEVGRQATKGGSVVVALLARPAEG